VNESQPFTSVHGLRSPKQPQLAKLRLSGWYNYYAGYAPEFVEDIATRMNLPEGSVLLDPWNGVGTTTQVAQNTGYRGIGFDLNPAVNLIAKARTLDASVTPSIGPLTAEILRTATLTRNPAHNQLESLTFWFTENTSQDLRRIERAIQRLLIDKDNFIRVVQLSSLKSISNLAAFFYTVLFRTVRTMLAQFRTSNPTWIIQKRSTRSPVACPPSEIARLFIHFTAEMARAIEASRYKRYPTLVDIAASTSLPLDNGSVAAVITSPPYCTRIDYAVTTSPELAVLGMDMGAEFKTFRDKMIGTPTIAKASPSPSAEWGVNCNRVLTIIARHESRAARSYYLKTYLQYFSDLNLSMREIARVLTPGGIAAIVVQDSYFKEVHIDLAKIVTQMGENHGMSMIGQSDFPQPRTMRSVNSKAREYCDKVVAVESVVILQQDREAPCLSKDN